MKNIGNLGASQSSPAMRGLTGQTAPQGSDGSIFAAHLTRQMNGTGAASNADGDAMSGMRQNPLGVDLAKLLTTLTKNKNTKSDTATNSQSDKKTDGPDANSALAMWLASMAALQMQPNIQNQAPQLNDFASQLTDSNSSQNSALQALEQQFPGLMQAMQKKPLANADDVNGQADAGQNADTKGNFEAAFQIPNADAQQPVPERVNTDPTPAVDKAAIKESKNKIDARSAIPAAGKNNQLQQAQPAPQGKTVDTKAQNQDQSPSGNNHSNNQTKKDTATTTAQPSQDQSNNSSATVNPATSSFAAMAHAATHGSSISSADATSHQPSTSTGQEINIREVGAAAGAEAAPRIVHAARLMEAAGQAEMRVSVKSEAAGSVDVRAMLEGDHISATVATQHDGTRDWMMANVHELHSSLSRDDMNLKSFEVSNSGLQFSGQNQPRQQEQQQQQQQSRAYTNFADETNSVSSAMNTDIDTEETASRALSLLA